VEGARDKNQLRDVLTKMVNELQVSHMIVHGGGGFTYSYGVDFMEIEGKRVVRATAQNSAAQRGGIERGWILTSAEGDCAGPNMKVSVRLLDLQEQTRNLELICGSYPFPSMAPSAAWSGTLWSVRPLEGGAFYVRVPRFGPDEGQTLARYIKGMRTAPAIVLDLRGNLGGPLDVLQKVLNLFFAEKTIIGAFRARDGKEITLKTNGGKSAYRGRLIVLIDGGTGSAAETFAKAIQETGRGVVIGQPSPGWVMGARNYKLPNDFDVGIAMLDYRTAKGVRLEGRGVQPDVLVNLTVKDFREKKDAVADRALQLLQGK
jgi:carboxyl-terminal processing protease